MIRLRCLFVFLLSLVVFSSCSNSFESRITNQVERYIPDLENFRSVFVIPGEGCSGCISSAIDLFHNVGDDGSILFIFTNVFSTKNLIIRLGEKYDPTSRNVIIDEENIFYESAFEESIYPYVMQIEDGQIVSCNRY